MIKVFNHWFHRKTIAQVAVDLMFPVLCVILAAMWIGRGGSPALDKVAFYAVVFAFTMIVLNAWLGIYQRVHSRTRTEKIAGQLGLTGINWGDAKVGNIGPNSLPSRMGDGTASLGGDPAYVWYATINPGGAQQVLVVYAVNNRIGKFHQPNADAAVKSIRKM